MTATLQNTDIFQHLRWEPVSTPVTYERPRPGSIEIRVSKKWKVLYHPDTGHELGMVTNSYGLIGNGEKIKLMEDLLAAGVVKDIRARSYKNDSLICIYATPTNNSEANVGGDTIGCRVLLADSYDRTITLNITASNRLIKDGSIIYSSCKPIKLRHYRSIKHKWTELSNAIEEHVKAFAEDTILFSEMAKRSVDSVDIQNFLDIILPTGSNKRMNNRSRDQMARLLLTDPAKDWWEVYTRIANHLTNESGRKNNREVSAQFGPSMTKNKRVFETIEGFIK